MTEEKKAETKEPDIYRDSLLRYLGKKAAITEWNSRNISMMQLELSINIVRDILDLNQNDNIRSSCRRWHKSGSETN